MDKQTESLVREKFEERVRFHYQYPELDIEPEDSPCAGEYVCTVRQDEWVQWKSAWQASRESLVVEIASHSEFEIEHMISPDKEGYSLGWIDGRNYAARQVQKIGIRIKGEGDGASS